MDLRKLKISLFCCCAVNYVKELSKKIRGNVSPIKRWGDPGLPPSAKIHFFHGQLNKIFSMSWQSFLLKPFFVIIHFWDTPILSAGLNYINIEKNVKTDNIKRKTAKTVSGWLKSLWYCFASTPVSIKMLPKLYWPLCIVPSSALFSCTTSIVYSCTLLCRNFFNEEKIGKK